MATQLNYTPNLWAQNLVGTSSNWIGCLVLDLSNPFYVPLVRAMEDIAGQNGYLIFLGESRRSLDSERAMVERFRRVKAAGVVISPVLADLDHLRLLQEETSQGDRRAQRSRIRLCECAQPAFRLSRRTVSSPFGSPFYRVRV